MHTQCVLTCAFQHFWSHNPDHFQTLLIFLSIYPTYAHRRALDLIFVLVDESNAEDVVGELVTSLSSAQSALKEDMVVKVAILAEKYSTGESVVSSDYWIPVILTRLISMALLVTEIIKISTTTFTLIMIIVTVTVTEVMRMRATYNDNHDDDDDDDDDDKYNDNLNNGNNSNDDDDDDFKKNDVKRDPNNVLITNVAMLYN